jgi:hypothetical protein
LHDITRFTQPDPSPKENKPDPRSLKSSKTSKFRKTQDDSSNADTHTNTKEQEDAENSLKVIDPDICVLFSRYMEAGKTINVYDWYESFAQGLEASRERIPAAPEKAGKGKAKSKSKTVDTDAKAVDEEVWRRETFARFMWSLHELDMLGMLRWSGRGSGKKGAECAGKVVWVTPE